MRFRYAMIVSAFALTLLTAVASAGDPQVPANCGWLPSFLCYTQPYCGKPAPCPLPCDYQKVCTPYCAKPPVCLPTPCFQWFPNNYCSKPPVCNFPGNPCPPCAASKQQK